VSAAGSPSARVCRAQATQRLCARPAPCGGLAGANGAPGSPRLLASVASGGL